MKILTLIIFAVGTFITTSESFGSNGICDITDSDRATILDSEPFEVNSDLLEAIRQNDVTTVGEVHFLTPLNGRERLIEQFSQLAGSDACVDFEFPYRNESALDFMIRAKDIIEKLKTVGDQGKPILETLQKVQNYYEPMITKATGLKMKTYGVDHQDNLERQLSIEERNHAMADHILDLHSKKECKHTLFFVGKAHLGINPDSTSRVQDLISEKGLSTTTINLQMTKEKDIPASLRSWAFCAENAHMPFTGYKFMTNKNIPGDPFLFLFNDSQAKWKDFDFTLFLTNQ